MPSWKISYNSGLGMAQIDPTVVDDTAKVPVGTRIKGYHDTLGEGEFIYLPGVASIVLGDCIVYDLKPAAQAVVRALSGTHLNTGRPVAFAMGAIVAAKYGWFQIHGVAVASVLAAFAAAQKLYLTATAGNLDDTTIAGCQLIGAYSSGAIDTPAVGKAYVTIAYPCIQTQIT